METTVSAPEKLLSHGGDARPHESGLAVVFWRKALPNERGVGLHRPGKLAHYLHGHGHFYNLRLRFSLS